MRKRFIYICSPCRGDMEKNITKAQGYCREAAELFPDVVPIAPTAPSFLTTPSRRNGPQAWTWGSPC
jgi:hypothetical protein